MFNLRKDRDIAPAEPYTREAFVRHAVLTLVSITLIALIFPVLGEPFIRSFLITHTFGWPIFICIFLALKLFYTQRWQKKYLFFGGAGVGVAIGLALYFLLFVPGWAESMGQKPVDLAHNLFIFFIIAVPIAALLFLRDQMNRVTAAYLSEQARLLESERRVAEAQLKMLQAQIEPHFLFNTLANVHGLIDASPALAKEMLTHLNDYLRGSLTRTRDGATTIRQELELLQAFLAIQKIRMGDRLDYAIHCDQALLDLPLPPLLLQPLVENAIRHGLEPKLEGGRVQVDVLRDSAGLLLTVTDTGLGIGQTIGGKGVGLGNVRERLQRLYGESAELLLQGNSPSGLIATIRLPC